MSMLIAAILILKADTLGGPTDPIIAEEAVILAVLFEGETSQDTIHSIPSSIGTFLRAEKLG